MPSRATCRPTLSCPHLRVLLDGGTVFPDLAGPSFPVQPYENDWRPSLTRLCISRRSFRRLPRLSNLRLALLQSNRGICKMPHFQTGRFYPVPSTFSIHESPQRLLVKPQLYHMPDAASSSSDASDDCDSKFSSRRMISSLSFLLLFL